MLGKDCINIYMDISCDKLVQQVQSLRAEEREQLEASISSLRRERDELESEKRRLERDVMESNDRIRNLQKQLNDAQVKILIDKELHE